MVANVNRNTQSSNKLFILDQGLKILVEEFDLETYSSAAFNPKHKNYLTQILINTI